MFRGDICRELIVKTKCSLRDISEITNISIGAFETYITEKGSKKGTQPSLEAIEKIADFFCVPVDLLLGRCTPEEQAAILSDYTNSFMKLRHCSYESYLIKVYGQSQNTISDKSKFDFEAPYPYNLMNRINGEPIKWLVRDENIKNLENALNDLPEKEREFILKYYKEQKSLKEMSEEYDLSRERIRQVICKGIKALRYPSIKNSIMGKFHSFEEIDEYVAVELKKIEKKETELKQREKELERRKNDIEEYLRDKENAIEEMVDCLKAQGISREQIFYPINSKKYNVYENVTNMPLDKVGLSVRAYNCLARSGLKTIGELVDALENDYEWFKSIRFLGNKSYEEIVTLLDKLYHTKRFTTLYNK